MRVAILTEEEKNMVYNQSYDNGVSYFMPVKDFYDNWIISELEILNCVHEDCLWLKNLELTDYVPKEEDISLFI